jgi:integrase
VTFGGALDFAVEKDALAENPLRQVKTTKRKTVFHEVDRRSVANPVQFRTVLNEVPDCGRIGRRLKLFFQLLYFAGLRPEEATNFRRNDLALPERTWNDEAQQWEVHEGMRSTSTAPRPRLVRSGLIAARGTKSAPSSTVR